MSLSASARAAALALMTWLLPSCVLNTFDVTYPLDKEPVAGLRRTYLSHDNRLDILIVHGMGTTLPGYSRALSDQIAKALDLAPGCVRTCSIDDGGRHYGELQRQEFGADRELVIYSLLWSPTTTPLKCEFLGGTVSDDAVAVNESLKKGLVNDRLSDPVLYAGTYAAAMRHPVEVALGWILDEQSTERPLAIVTYSLGSKMFFDAFRELQKDTEDVRLAALAKRTSEVYMFANQLPLLALATVPSASAARAATLDAQDPGIASFLTVRVAPVADLITNPGRLVCVAFTDPNDLLSYPITKRFAKAYPTDKVAFVNVEVSVARIAWLGVLANPLQAHNGYDDTDRVMSVVLEGWPLDG